MASIDTPSKRARLGVRKNPWWTAVGGGRGGVSLGYRRTSVAGQGRWIAKIVLDGARIEETIGLADDDGAPHGAIAYRIAVAAALEWSSRKGSSIAARQEADAPANGGPTVRQAIEAHIARRKAQDGRNGGITAGRLTMHALSDDKFGGIPLARLRASDIERWRSRLPTEMAPATQNRLLADLRAALNAAAEKHRRELPAYTATEISVGTRAVPVPVEERARKQFLSDDEVRGVIEAGFAINDDGDFGRLVLLAAITGARHSQIAALTVGDLQPERGRILMPGSRKGRSARAKPKQPVPLPAYAIERLIPAIKGRKGGEPLLMRWAYRKSDGPIRWRRSFRRAWGPAYEVNALWSRVIAGAGLPGDTVMYALRHSSILRGLKANLPVRLVAAQHDTSTAMIETHYSAFITDASEDLLRKASLAAPPLAGVEGGRMSNKPVKLAGMNPFAIISLAEGRTYECLIRNMLDTIKVPPESGRDLYDALEALNCNDQVLAGIAALDDPDIHPAITRMIFYRFTRLERQARKRPSNRPRKLPGLLRQAVDGFVQLGGMTRDAATRRVAERLELPLSRVREAVRDQPDRKKREKAKVKEKEAKKKPVGPRPATKKAGGMVN